MQRVVVNPSGLAFEAEAPPPIPPEVVSRDKTRALGSALRAGAIAAVLSVIPFGFILALPLGGFLSMLLYRRRGWARQPTPAAGFRLGALTGVFAFAIVVVLESFDTLISRASIDVRQMMIETVRRAELRNPDPLARAILEYLTTPPGLIIMMISGLISLCLVFVLLAGIGGAFGAALNRRNRPPG